MHLSVFPFCADLGFTDTSTMNSAQEYSDPKVFVDIHVLVAS